MGGTTVFAYLGRVYIPYTYASRDLCGINTINKNRLQSIFTFINKKERCYEFILSVPYNNYVSPIQHGNACY